MDIGLMALRARKLMTSLRSPASRAALVRHRVGPAIEHRHLASLCPRTIIDVGANRGQFALALAELLPKARIICVEPVTAAFAVLTEVTAPLGPRVQCHNVAIGKEAGEAELFVASSDDNSSMLRPGDKQLALTRSAKTVSSAPVVVRRLDDLIDASDLVGPTLLKIDVQGTELDVLSGASGLLNEVSAVCAEVSFCELYIGHSRFQSVCALLEDAGLALTGLRNPTRLEGVIVQGDALFRRATHHRGPRVS